MGDGKRLPAVRLGPWVLAVLPADIDSVSAPDLGQRLGSLLDPDVGVLVADLTQTGFCDSAGVRMLLLTNRQAAACGAEFRLVVPGSGVQRILQLLGADRVLQLFASMEEALADAPAHVRAGNGGAGDELGGPAQAG